MAIVLLIALGQAGREPTLKDLLADQLKNAGNIGCIEASTTFWWRLFRTLGAITAIMLSTFVYLSDGLTFGISAAVMGAEFIIFLCGYPTYYNRESVDSPLTTVFHVITVAIRKRGSPLSDDPNDYYKNEFGEKQPLMPDISLFRWLDKAALVETSTIGPEEQVRKWKLCTVEQVKSVKRSLRMLPMWMSFFVYSLVSAAGSTFFFEQTSKLNDQIHIDHLYITIPLTIFYLIQTISSSIISSTYEYLVPKRWPKNIKLGATKLRMGLGMVCSFLCCVTAWKVETRRLNYLALHTDQELEELNTDMSVFWLAPQFCLLGLMEGLAEDGLNDFFNFQVVESMKSYGPTFTEFTVGLGKFNSLLFMFIFKGWFGVTINDSKVNNYYGVLALASFGNFFIFLFICNYVYKNVNERKENLVDEVEDDVKRIQAIGISSNDEDPNPPPENV